DRNRPPPCLDELHEAIRRVERELHGADRTRTYVRLLVCQSRRSRRIDSTHRSSCGPRMRDAFRDLPAVGGPRGGNSRERISAPQANSVDGLLELRACRELRDVGGLDLHPLARPGVHALARRTPRDVELAEPGEGDRVAVLEGPL